LAAYERDGKLFEVRRIETSLMASVDVVSPTQQFPAQPSADSTIVPVYQASESHPEIEEAERIARQVKLPPETVVKVLRNDVKGIPAKDVLRVQDARMKLSGDDGNGSNGAPEPGREKATKKRKA
jgi:hypothetical protein